MVALRARPFSQCATSVCWKQELQGAGSRPQRGVRLPMASCDHDLVGVLSPDLGGPPRLGFCLLLPGVYQVLLFTGDPVGSKADLDSSLARPG